MVDNHETYNVDNDRKPAADVPLTLTTTLPPLSVGGATATRALPGNAGAVVDAKTLKESSLSEIRDMFAVVVDTVDDLKK